MMNANELADALDDIAQNSTRIHVHIKEHLTKAATMLRQLEGQLKWEQEEVERVSEIQMKYAEKIEQLQAENEALKAKFKAKTEAWLDSIRADAEFYNSRDKKQKAKIKKLKHDISQHISINTELATENMALRKEIEELKRKTATGYETR